MNSSTALVLPSARPWIGGSSISAILGLPNPSKRTPLTEYLRLTTPQHELDAADEEFFEGRRALEPYMAHKLRYRGVTATAFNHRYFDPEYPFLAAEIDAETADQNNEFKTSTEYLSKNFGEEGTDDFPMYQAAQVQWGLGLHPKPVAYLNVCLGFDRFKRFPVEPDPGLFLDMKARALAFWNDHVVPRIPPAPVTLEDAKLLWPKSLGNSILATPEMIDALTEHAKIKHQISDLETAEELAKVRIQAMLGEAEQALLSSGKPAVTWKNNKDSMVLDIAGYIEVLECQLTGHDTGYARFFQEQRELLTKPKPGPRVLRNKLAK